MDSKKIDNWKIFNLIDIRIGSILKAMKFVEAKKPAYKLIIDFGSLGILNSSAQITELYSIEELIGKDVVAVINIGNKKIHKFTSECLVLGVSGIKGVSLIKSSQKIESGSSVFID